MKPDVTAFLETARRLAHQAAEVIMQMRDRPMKQYRKEDRSLVTAADLRSDEIIKQGLRETFPKHAILTEEAGLSGNTDSEYVWLIDPLDGTKAYAKGIPGFAVMVGLLKDFQPYLGIVIDPIEDLTYEAIRGQGAFLTQRGERSSLQVSTRSDYSEMPLVVSTGFPEEKLERLREDLTGPQCDPINSVGIKVGHVVRQEADIYLNHHSVHLWDTCAPQIILEEAGGSMTRLDGSPLTYTLKAPYSHEALTIATNGTRHEDLVRLIDEKKLF